MWTDSSWNNDPDTSRSRSGYVTKFNNCAVSWNSTMQKQVTLSSCEAEYIALGDAVKEALWLKELLTELRFPQGPIRIYIDNKSAMQLAKIHMLRPRSKHIAMRHHWVREKVQAGDIELVYVPTAENTADMMTKNLGRAKMQQLLQGILE